jgi:hypothetical protein
MSKRAPIVIFLGDVSAKGLVRICSNRLRLLKAVVLERCDAIHSDRKDWAFDPRGLGDALRTLSQEATEEAADRRVSHPLIPMYALAIPSCDCSSVRVHSEWCSSICSKGELHEP